jgi:hypothetical protein
MERIVVKQDVQGYDLHHHEEQEVEIPSDEEKNITHLGLSFKFGISNPKSVPRWIRLY